MTFVSWLASVSSNSTMQGFVRVFCSWLTQLIKVRLAQDAEDAVRDCNGKDFMGDRLLVEFAKSPRSFDGPPRDRNERGPSVSYPPTRYRTSVWSNPFSCSFTGCVLVLVDLVIESSFATCLMAQAGRFAKTSLKLLLFLSFSGLMAWHGIIVHAFRLGFLLEDIPGWTRLALLDPVARLDQSRGSLRIALDKILLLRWCHTVSPWFWILQFPFALVVWMEPHYRFGLLVPIGSQRLCKSRWSSFIRRC